MPSVRATRTPTIGRAAVLCAAGVALRPRTCFPTTNRAPLRATRAATKGRARSPAANGFSTAPMGLAVRGTRTIRRVRWRIGASRPRRHGGRRSNTRRSLFLGATPSLASFWAAVRPSTASRRGRGCQVDPHHGPRPEARKGQPRRGVRAKAAHAKQVVDGLKGERAPIRVGRLRNRMDGGVRRFDRLYGPSVATCPPHNPSHPVSSSTHHQSIDHALGVRGLGPHAL